MEGDVSNTGVPAPKLAVILLVSVQSNPKKQWHVHMARRVVAKHANVDSPGPNPSICLRIFFNFSPVGFKENRLHYSFF